ncbi:MAG: hypothetical protein Q8O66_00265 [bacterium]|nr:hypothetical protein [bacterium]
MFWSRDIRKKIDGVELSAGVVIVEADTTEEAWERIKTTEAGWEGNNPYCVGSIKGPYNTKEAAELPQ